MYITFKTQTQYPQQSSKERESPRTLTKSSWGAQVRPYKFEPLQVVASPNPASGTALRSMLFFLSLSDVYVILFISDNEE